MFYGKRQPLYYVSSIVPQLKAPRACKRITPQCLHSKCASGLLRSRVADSNDLLVPWWISTHKPQFNGFWQTHGWRGASLWKLPVWTMINDPSFGTLSTHDISIGVYPWVLLRALRPPPEETPISQDLRLFSGWVQGLGKSFRVKKAGF